MIRYFISAFSAVVITFIPCSTGAHDIWDNNLPVPSWIRTECGGIHDAHHLKPEQVRLDKGGYIVDGYPYVISSLMLQPSIDREWWVFYRETDEGMFSGVYCFFGPANS